MKTVPKVLLLLFGLTQLFFVLYISLPTIPRRIKNEEIGNMYAIGNISFNLSSDQYKENEEIKEALGKKGEDPNKLVVLVDITNNDSIVIFEVLTEESQLLIDESFQTFSNPFQNRFVTKEIQETMPNTSERIARGEQIKEIEHTVYKGQNKVALLTSVTIDNLVEYHLDVKIGDFYYTVIPQRLEDYDTQLAFNNIMEFLRTSSLNN